MKIQTRVLFTLDGCWASSVTSVRADLQINFHLLPQEVSLSLHAGGVRPRLNLSWRGGQSSDLGPDPYPFI